MAEIFGGSLRFVVRRDRPEKTPGSQKFNRSVTRVGNVSHDDAIYRYSGLRFWDRLLPDISTAPGTELHEAAFPEADWTYFNAGPQQIMMMAKRADAEIHPKLDAKSLVVIRYRVIVDTQLPWAKLRVYSGSSVVEDVVVAQSEDRVLRLLYSRSMGPIRFELTAIDGQRIDAKGRLRIPILQAIPLEA